MLTLCACAQTAPQKPASEKSGAVALSPISFGHLDGWRDDDQAAALLAFRRSCARLLKKSASSTIGSGPVARRAADWHVACRSAQNLSGDNKRVRRFFESAFTPYLLSEGNNPEGLFTGYYEPELFGSMTKNARFNVPLYAMPNDLVKVNLGSFKTSLKGQSIVGRINKGRLVPYPSRTAIDKGVLAKNAKPLLWVDNPTDAFFLHIQGSGRVLLADGSHVRLGYAGANGHKYVAIGRELIARGEVSRKDMSMQAIRRWIAANPKGGRKLMQTNPSYIFFRILKGDGPIGAQGVALTAERSLAVDRRYVPYGAPIWLQTTEPLHPQKPYRRLLIAQDTGGAIKGVVRGDVFFGFGADAAKRAGVMKNSGSMVILLPKRR